MKIYFVRHAQTDGNLNEWHHVPETPLTELGKRQAHETAIRLSRLPIEYIVASTYTRGRETAEIINEKLQKPLQYTSLLNETRKPSFFYGRKEDDPEVAKIEKEIRVHTEEPNWRYSDEESFSDIHRRGFETLRFIQTISCENILVITHGNFTRVLAGCALFDQEFDPNLFARFSHSLRVDNAGISMMEYRYSRSQAQFKWYINFWNDGTHLANLL